MLSHDAGWSVSTDPDHIQLDWLGGDLTPRLKRTTARANRKQSSTSAQRSLPIDDGFLPRVGTPGTRADCPDTSKQYCPYLRCRWHLARLDAQDRAGRPGLSAVPRDARGWTIAVEGDLGAQTAGTTADPTWLGLESSAKMRVDYNKEGNVIGVETYNPAPETDLCNWPVGGKHVGTWDMMSETLYVDEPIDVYNDLGERVCGARLTADGQLAFDGSPGGAIVVTLRRVRLTESCALDAIARHGKMGNQAIGDCIGRHRTLVAREVKGALAKAIETGEDMGIERHELMGALMRMGEP